MAKVGGSTSEPVATARAEGPEREQRGHGGLVLGLGVATVAAAAGVFLGLNNRSRGFIIEAVGRKSAHIGAAAGGLVSAFGAANRELKKRSDEALLEPSDRLDKLRHRRMAYSAARVVLGTLAGAAAGYGVERGWHHAVKAVNVDMVDGVREGVRKVTPDIVSGFEQAFDKGSAKAISNMEGISLEGEKAGPRLLKDGFRFVVRTGGSSS